MLARTAAHAGLRTGPAAGPCTQTANRRDARQHGRARLAMCAARTITVLWVSPSGRVARGQLPCRGQHEPDHSHDHSRNRVRSLPDRKIRILQLVVAPLRAVTPGESIVSVAFGSEPASPARVERRRRTRAERWGSRSSRATYTFRTSPVTSLASHPDHQTEYPTSETTSSHLEVSTTPAGRRPTIST